MSQIAKINPQQSIPALAMSEGGFERFVAIPGYEGMYEISTYGNVISLARTSCPPSGKKQTTNSRVIKPKSNGNGYMAVSLWKDGKEKSQYVHRLVLGAFSGACPDGSEACHNNGRRWHNHLSNLRWDTKKSNHADKFVHGTVRNGEKARAAKLTADKVIAIRMMILDGEEQNVIAERFSVSQPTISDIANRRTWKHI